MTDAQILVPRGLLSSFQFATRLHGRTDCGTLQPSQELQRSSERNLFGNVGMHPQLASESRHTTHFPKGTGLFQSCFLCVPDFNADLENHKRMTGESKNELLEIKKPME